MGPQSTLGRRSHVTTLGVSNADGSFSVSCRLQGKNGRRNPRTGCSIQSQVPAGANVTVTNRRGKRSPDSLTSEHLTRPGTSPACSPSNSACENSKKNWTPLEVICRLYSNQAIETACSGLSRNERTTYSFAPCHSNNVANRLDFSFYHLPYTLPFCSHTHGHQISFLCPAFPR